MTNETIKAEATGKTLIPAWGYLRVSGSGQLDKDGEARQKEVIQGFASRRGYEVIRWFFDGAVSGEVDAIDRDKFGEMLLLSGPRTATTVLVERADRLARTLMVCELACEEARKQGVTIIDCSGETDLTNSDDPTRVLIRQVMGAVAEWNKNVMVKRLATARKRIRETGRRCEGPRPFGNRTDDELFIATEILRFRDEERMSWGEIVKRLKFLKLKTARGGDEWCRAAVRNVYDREKEISYALKGSRVIQGSKVLVP